MRPYHLPQSWPTIDEREEIIGSRAQALIQILRGTEKYYGVAGPRPAEYFYYYPYREPQPRSRPQQPAIPQLPARDQQLSPPQPPAAIPSEPCADGCGPFHLGADLDQPFEIVACTICRTTWVIYRDRKAGLHA